MMKSETKEVIGASIAVLAAVGILGAIIYRYLTEDERQAAKDLVQINSMVLPEKAYQATLIENREISNCVDKAMGAELRKHQVLSILPFEDKQPHCWDDGIYNTDRRCSYPWVALITTESAWDGEKSNQTFTTSYDDLKLGWTSEISYTLTMEDGANVRIDPLLMKVATPTQVCRSLTKKLQGLIEQRLD